MHCFIDKSSQRLGSQILFIDFFIDFFIGTAGWLGSVLGGFSFAADVATAAVGGICLTEICKQKAGTAGVLLAHVFHHGFHTLVPSFFQHLVAGRGKLHVAGRKVLTVKGQHIGTLPRNVFYHVLEGEIVQCLPEVRDRNSASLGDIVFFDRNRE